MSRLNTFIKPDGDSGEQLLVIGDGDTGDDLQESGRWIATDTPAEVRS